jgi:hypothetical protein
MAIPHRNYASCVATQRPNYHDQSVAKIAGGDEPVFAIGIPGVLERGNFPSEHQPGISEIKTAFRKGLGTFRKVEADVHELLYIR